MKNLFFLLLLAFTSLTVRGQVALDTVMVMNDLTFVWKERSFYFTVVDKNGKFLIPDEYDLLTDSETIPTVDVWENRKQVLLKEDCCDEKDFDFLNGLVPCLKGEKKGFYDINRQKEAIPFEYDRVGKFIKLEWGSLAAIVKKNGFYGVIDDKNRVLLDFEYTELAWDTKYRLSYDSTITIFLVGRKSCGGYITSLTGGYLVFRNLIDDLKKLDENGKNIK